MATNVRVGTEFRESSWQNRLRTCSQVMSTGPYFNSPLKQSYSGGRSFLDCNNHFKSCQWSPDGTTLLTSSADNVLRSFILPPDLLETPNSQALRAYHEHILPGSAYATAIHPSFSLNEPSAALYLASTPNLPTRLISPFSTSIVATYPLVNPTTEAFVAPHAIIFNTHASHESTHFLAGSDSQISIFDLNRPGQPPHTTLKTIASKRKKLLGGGLGMKGLVSAISLSSDGILAAGTFTRWVGLFDGGGRGSEIGVFQLGRESGDRDGAGDGRGVTQLSWSQDGKYLITAERMTNGLSVWDVRGTGKRLAWLTGRNAHTMQRMGIDVVGNAVIAGDMDGNVRIWETIGRAEGVVEATLDVKLHEDAIPSATMHPSAAVLATCSGQRHEPSPSSNLSEVGQDDIRNHSEEDTILATACTAHLATDNSLRIWSLYPELRQAEG